MKAIGKILLVLVALELALGGGGRLVDVGWFSPRMLLFCGALAYAAFILGLARSRIPWEFACLILGFCALLLFHGAVSIVRQMPYEAIFEDAKPQLYFPMLAFLAITIRNVRDVATVTKLLKISAVVLSIAYLGVLSLWHSGVFTFDEVQGALNPTGDTKKEFYFRSDATFFFKAALYVGVGLFFFLFHGGSIGKLVAVLLFLALFFTLTRGLMAAVFLSLATCVLLFHKNRLAGVALAGTNLVLGLFAILVINELAPTAGESVALRLADLRATAEIWDVPTILIGQGLGPSIGARGHIEMNYIEILYKQGLLGLSFWLLPIAYITLQMSRAMPERRTNAMPYYLAALFVYFENATNPFLTNPIGMSVVLIAMVAIRVLSSQPLSTRPTSYSFDSAGVRLER